MAIPVIHAVGLPKNHMFDAKLQYTAWDSLGSGALVPETAVMLSTSTNHDLEGVHATTTIMSFATVNVRHATTPDTAPAGVQDKT